MSNLSPETHETWECMWDVESHFGNRSLVDDDSHAAEPSPLPFGFVPVKAAVPGRDPWMWW